MPALCIWAAGSLFWTATDRAFVIPQVSGVWVVNSAMVAAPFFGLAWWATGRIRKSQGDQMVRPLLAAAALGVASTGLVWSAFYYEGYTYWAESKATGVNMGSACFMLLSPAIIGVLMTGVLWLLSPSRSRRAE